MSTATNFDKLSTAPRPKHEGLAALIWSDIAEARRVYGTYVYTLHPGVIACVVYRLAHATAKRGVAGRLASQMLSLVNMLVTGADIHAAAQIGPRLRIPHAAGVLVGAGVVAGEGLTLYGGTVLGAVEERFPTLGDNVTLWAKASVLGGVTVGNNAQIGAHAVVLKDVPDAVSAIGVPAKTKSFDAPGADRTRRARPFNGERRRGDRRRTRSE